MFDREHRLQEPVRAADDSANGFSTLGGEALRSSRREFLARGGALAGVAVMTVPGVARAAKPATGTAAATTAAVAAAALTPARRATYGALVDTVLAEPGLRLDPAAADAAASEFAAHYATWPPDAQRRADDVLDALDTSTGRSFAQLGRPARTAHLRTCARPTDDDPVGAERRRLDMAQSAMSLAAVTVGPSGGELDRPLDSV
ncbi:MAG: hypothetical protein QOH72_549 [Solirubrobacteraceae bacterium]|jgi:hypothetical protein|nr:hypothetical protein [Solirubrobacteraceae bacterium]